MVKSEKGSTLIIVLLVILVFAVLGLSLMGSVVGEGKRVHKTESSIGARNLARDGLTYFETDFKNYVKKNEPAITIGNFLAKYADDCVDSDCEQEWVTIGDKWTKKKPKEIKIRVELPERNKVDDTRNRIKVYSQGRDEDNTETLISYYNLDFEVDFDKPTDELAKFEEARPIDFTDLDLIGLDLSLLNLDLIDITGGDKRFYRIPVDKVIEVNLLTHILNISIGDGDRFGSMENNRVVATRKGKVLGLDLFEFEREEGPLATVDLIKFKQAKDTNVIIDGGFTAVEILGIRFNGYRDIDFKKLAVMGNVLMQQDRNGTEGLTGDKKNTRRRFTFNEGLYVNKGLVIGGVQGNQKQATKLNQYSKLLLRGDMVTMEDLRINDVDLLIGDASENEGSLTPEDKISNLYVHGDTRIHNACMKWMDGYDLRLFSKEKITIENNEISASCREMNGLFYSEAGIEIKTFGRPMTIIGGVIGDLTVDYPEKLTIIEDPKYLQTIKFCNIELDPKGRSFDENEKSNSPAE